ncbi:MAG: putative phage tail protein, partial [Spirochaetota bacterium]
MGLMQRALKNLLPDGQAWRLPTTFRQVIEALGTSLERLRLFVDGIIDESLPSTAETTLPEWYTMLGLPYDATQTLETRRNQAKQSWIAVGGQNLDYLNETIQIAFPDVEIQTVQGYFAEENMVGIGMVGLMQTTDYPSWMTSTPTDGSWPYAYYRVVGEVPDTSDLNRLLGILDRIAPAEM